MKITLDDLLAGAGYLFTAGLFVLGGIHLYNNSVSCENIETPFKTVRKNDPDSEKGERFTYPDGSKGETRICKRRNGDIASKEVIVKPTHKVIHVGTRKPEPVAPATRVGCIDVTSYDYNWDNDVLCTRADGSQFYTSYEGADAFMGY